MNTTSEEERLTPREAQVIEACRGGLVLDAIRKEAEAIEEHLTVLDINELDHHAHELARLSASLAAKVRQIADRLEAAEREREEGDAA